MSRSRIGIFGGTFDPVHLAHLRAALEVLEALDLDEMRFMPCNVPPHRQRPVASAAERLEMVRLAVADEPRFDVDARELDREGPSYSVDTLASLREEYPDAALCLLMGMDQFQALTTWDRWESIPARAHVVVMHRPGWTRPDAGTLAPVLAAGMEAGALRLREERAGAVVFVPITPLDVSSTAIRGLVAAGRDVRYLVPDSVRARMLSSGCYKQDRGVDGA